MKSFNRIIAVMFLLFQIVHCTLNIENCEGQWVLQTVPQNYGIVLAIDFESPVNGVSCGWYNFYGRALFTSDGGTNWLPSAVPDSSRSFTAVSLIDPLTGYMAGAYNLFPAEISNSNLKDFHKKGFSSSMIEHLENLGLSSYADYKGLFIKTTDGGRNWFTYGILPLKISYLTGMDFLDANTGVVITSIQDTSLSMYSTILKTTNGGLTWDEILNIDSVYEFREIKFIDSDNIIALGWGGSSDSLHSNTGGMIFRSTNAGINWSLQFFLYREFTDVSFSDNSTGFLSATFNGDGLVYKTTDKGNSWNIVYTHIDNSTLISGINFHKESGTGMIYGNLWAPPPLDSYAGFTVRTTDYGASWGQMQYLDTTGQNLFYGGTMISQYDQYICGGNPFAQAAIYHTTNGGAVSINQQGNLIPVMFSLSQNYPNPFNPVTNLEFGISDLEFVSLKVYDILGKKIITLVNEKLSPGNYKVEFDGSGLTSGVYFYRLNAGEFTETKRMMLIK
jgi:photosystem II stability/assembly factor-like uncharacterized protein